MPYVRSAFYLNEYLHHYNRINPNSLTKTYNNTLREKFSNLFKELNTVIESNYKDSDDFNTYTKALKNRIALSTINIGLSYVANVNNKSGFRLFKELISSDMYQESFKTLETKNLPIHFRVFFVSCKYRITYLAFNLIRMMQKLR
jgi:hypothetical protein